MEKVKTKAGINKKANPHMLRHGSASYFCDHLTDSDMEDKYGWARGSPHKARYQHKHGRAIETKLLRMAGIYADTGVKNIYQEAEETVQECYYCKEKNQTNNTTCWKCGRLLNISMSIEIQTLKETVDSVSMSFLKDNPLILKQFVDSLSKEAEKTSKKTG
jgi:hypothetical protein